MPFTPFHVGPALVLWAVLYPRINLFSILVGAVILDLEPFYYLVNGEIYLHRFFHTILGASLVGMVLTPIITKSFHLKPGNIAPGVFLGLYSHIFLDSFLYFDIRPFYPLDYNPMLGWVSSKMIYYFSAISFIPGMIFLFRAYKKCIKII